MRCNRANRESSVPSQVEEQTRRPTVLAWLRLLRAYHLIEHAAAEHLKRWDLSFAQFDVLVHVGAAEGLMQQELADARLVTKGNVCQLLDRMEQRGLLRRQQEGRAKRLFLTPAGRALYDEVVPAHEGLIEAQFEALSPTDRGQLLRLLRKLERSLRDGGD